MGPVGLPRTGLAVAATTPIVRNVEAAHIAWRPLGQLLVEQGLLTERELELALARQKETGQRLGETIVQSGFVSGPELANALAAQYGIELTTETGFGTGLRSQIQRRHETDRRSVVRLAAVPDESGEEVPADAVDPDPGGDSVLLAQLEEQWARLAAAEAALAEREREMRELEEANAQLRQRFEDLHGGLQAAPEPEPAADSHLVFVHLGGGYALVHRDGPPPIASTTLELPDVDEGVFVVAGSRQSPLPGDTRPCVVAQRA